MSTIARRIARTLLARIEPQMSADELAQLGTLDLRSRLIAKLAAMSEP